MVYSNDIVYQEIIKSKDRYINKLEKWLLVVSLLVGLSTGSFASVLCDEQHQIKELKTEIKSKDKQIQGLSEQVSRQTKRIAELTRNGG